VSSGSDNSSTIQSVWLRTMPTDTTEKTSPPELNTMRIEIDERIGILTLDRPDALNAMSPEMIGEMTIAFAWLADRARLRGLIVTGAGRAFSSGGDVTWFRKGVED
jgi:2-(1,2-epoxy-1,2-dihydrophenyl)acetyl-CoA isomerase